MKWLSATAVFAAILPSVSIFGDPVNVTLNTNHRGTGSSTSDAELKDFTQATANIAGTQYNVSGDVSFSTFTNITPTPPLPEPTQDPSTYAQSETPTTNGGDGEGTTPTEGSTPTEVTSWVRPHKNLINKENPSHTFRDGAFQKAKSLPRAATNTQIAEDFSIRGGGAFYNEFWVPIYFITDTMSPGSLTLENITMVGKGGAIYSSGGAHFDGLKNLTCTGNLSQDCGGAIYVGEDSVSIKNIVNAITFSGNAAQAIEFLEEANPTTSASAQADPSTIVITGSGDGGAICSEGAVDIDTYADMFFTSNSAIFPTEVKESDKNYNLLKEVRGSGGAIFSTGPLAISNGSGITNFESNTATCQGGAIYGDTITFTDVAHLQFQSNQSGGAGGAIYGKSITASYSEVPLKELENASNSLESQTPPLRKIYFNGNSGSSGGAIYSLGNITLSSFNEVIFTSNETTYVAPMTSPTSSSIDDIGRGGAIYASGEFSAINVGSLRIEQNRSLDSGGSIYAAGFSCSDSGKLQLQSNFADKDGGGIYSTEDVILSTVSGESFVKDNLATSGGGIYVAKSFNVFNVEDLTIEANTSAGGDGGGIYAGSISFNDAILPGDAPTQTYGILTIKNNSALASEPPPPEGQTIGPMIGGNGGGVYATTDITLSQLSKLAILDNTASSKGGGVYNHQTVDAASVQLPPVVSPLLADDMANFTVNYINSAVVANNAATEGDGGGIHSAVCLFSEIDELQIFANAAGKSGGGIFTKSLAFTSINNISIAQNHSRKQGGAVYAEKLLLFTNLPKGFVFEQNKIEAETQLATDHLEGGAVYAPDFLFFQIQGSGIFRDNVVLETNTTPATENPPSSTPADPNVLGGAVCGPYVKFIGDKTHLSFIRNCVATNKSATSGLVAGGAIYSSQGTTLSGCTLLFSENSALLAEATGQQNTVTNPQDTLGGALGTLQKISIQSKTSASFYKNSADRGSAIGAYDSSTTGDVANQGTVVISGAGTILFDSNKANKRGTIFAQTLSISNSDSISFINNESAYDGSAIYFTKQCDISAKGTILFQGNKVTSGSVTPIAASSSQPLAAQDSKGAAIYGEDIGNNATDPTLNLTATKGSIIFRDNICSANNKYCSIAGNVNLQTLNAVSQQGIYFYDPLSITTLQTQSINTLNINQTNGGTTYTGVIAISAALHENKSSIAQNAVLHAGTLSLGKNAELSVISFDQKVGSKLLMAPASTLSTMNNASGGLAINNLVIDLSTVDTFGSLFTPPTLKLVPTTSGAQTQPGASSGASPDVTQDKIYLSGSISLLNPRGEFYQNPILGRDLDIPLVNLVGAEGATEITDLSLTGDIEPKKGYIGKWELQSTPVSGQLIAKWTFEEYRRWIYIPRDNYFYINSILGAQNSLISVKQGLVNNMLSNARFDDASYNNIWLVGIGSFIQHQGGNQSTKFSYHSRGFSLAVDAKPRSDFIMGAAFSQMFGKSNSVKTYDNYRHTGLEHSFQGSLYTGKSFYLLGARSRLSRPLLFQGILTYGYIRHDTTTYYPSIEEKNRGEWEDIGWLGSVRVTVDMKEPSKHSSLRLSFYSEGEYSSIRQKQFTELDYDPRHFGNSTYRNLALPTGVLFEGALMRYRILMYNKLALAYLPVIYRNSPSCSCTLLSKDTTETVIGGIPTRSSGRCEYSIQLYLGPYWTLYGSYTVDAGIHSLTQMANAGIRMIF